MSESHLREALRELGDRLETTNDPAHAERTRHATP